MKETDPHLEKFKRFEKEVAQPAWVFPLRKAGIAQFADLGFPTLQHEDWRFTNVAPIAKLPFNPVFQPSKNGVVAERLSEFTFGKLRAIRLVFVNGHHVAGLSSPDSEKQGITATSLALALTRDSTLLE